MKAVYRHNFKRNFFNHQNCQRAYVFNDESGLILCSWPQGGIPEQPFVYSDEVWTGIEYEVATLLIYEGMVDDGLGIVKAIRKRHDGVHRNPWNEVECGNHYARSMASWAILLALSGFQYDAHSRVILFNPAYQPENFRCLFNTGSCWGHYSQRIEKDGFNLNIEIIHGSLAINRLQFFPLRPFSIITARVDSNSVPVNYEIQSEKTILGFEPDVVIHEGNQLAIRFE